MEGNILNQKTKFLQQKTVIDKEDSLVISEEDSFMFDFKFKFGRKKMKNETVQKVNKVEITPRKIQEEMRAKPRMTKDATRTARNGRPSQERSPGLGGRGMMKQLRCTPRKISKISRVSTLKHFFEKSESSSLTRGPMELLLQSTEAVNFNLGRATTTTGDAADSRKDCASQSEQPIGTGPRQTAYLGLSLSQDWTSQTWGRDRGPMGDALLGLGDVMNKK